MKSPSRARLLPRLSRSDLPPVFWYLWTGTLINRLGGFAVPFLMLYLTGRLVMAPATAALLVSLLGAGSFVSQLTGGELADRLGRRPVMLLSFSGGPVAMLTVGLTHDPVLLAVAMFVLGFFMNLYRPAVNAAIVDLVPQARRTSAFGYIYWAVNLGAALAPIAAGVMANFDYFLLFAGDALTTAVFGAIVFLRVPETQPAHAALAAHVSLRERGRQVGREPILLAFALLTLLWGMVYDQGEIALPLAMSARGLPPSDYGLALAINGGLIVLVTIQITRRLERSARFPWMAIAALLIGAGFGLTAFADTLPFYALTVVVWTVGEIIGAALAPSIIGDLSPPELRGLYQGVWGAAWGLAAFFGPAVGGYVYGQISPNVLWAGCLVTGLAMFAGFLLLAVPARRHASFARPVGR